jgi:hypothetical protein
MLSKYHFKENEDSIVKIQKVYITVHYILVFLKLKKKSC